MSALSKTPVSKSAGSQADLRGTNLYRVAIVGAASLKGKEVAEILRERKLGWTKSLIAVSGKI